MADPGGKIAVIGTSIKGMEGNKMKREYDRPDL
jgi:hypothetical protein